ncbi:CocE/NonD family hydrolase [Streptomyces sp. S4.7]|uniref:CocE/NonD family hydrolase n=1 Tax=Streptomyces sp. S4.7 TaxID=2705439 RepID=UPI00193EF6E4|nr:CocE/NonD family hydrolase [Streptomyces sp. S4.7]
MRARRLARDRPFTGPRRPVPPRETRDFHDGVEWAVTRDWSNGRVGLNGISYYAMNQ